MGFIRSMMYTAVVAGALYVGAQTGGCDYVLEKVGASESTKKKAKDSSKKYVDTIDSLADTAKDAAKDAVKQYR